jgi:hypothetical protein
MAISSGRGAFVRLPKMVRAREFFGIGEPFWYTPLADKDTNILIEAIPCTNVTPPEVDGFSQRDCEKHCALSKWCSESGNFDESGSNYIPCCSDYEREDKTNVFFKEIG